MQRYYFFSKNNYFFQTFVINPNQKDLSPYSAGGQVKKKERLLEGSVHYLGRLGYPLKRYAIDKGKI